MLNFNLNNGILEVEETVHSFTRTKVSYWYYDLTSWKKSSHGRKGDVPDRVMSDHDKDWVIKHYIPKVVKDI
jgi:hypothetical protein